MGAQAAGAQVKEQDETQSNKRMAVSVSDSAGSIRDSGADPGNAKSVTQPEPAPLQPEDDEKANSNTLGTGGGADGDRRTSDAPGDGSKLADVPVGAGETGVVSVGKKLANRSASLRNTMPLPALMADAPIVGKTAIAPVGKSVGIPVGKPKIAQQKQQVTKIDWYRYELDFRPLKSGFNVLIRKRLRWSESRYSKMIVKRTCPRLTKRMVEQISVGRFPQTVIAALQDGGIQDGFIKALQERIGKGNGRRKSELTELERSLLARIESSLVASNRGRNREA